MLKISFVFVVFSLFLVALFSGVPAQATNVFDINDYKGIFISEIHYDAHDLDYDLPQNLNKCRVASSNSSITCTSDKWFEITNFSQKNINLNQLAIAQTNSGLNLKILNNDVTSGYILEVNKSVVVSEKALNFGLVDTPEFDNINVFKSRRGDTGGVNILSSQNTTRNQVTGYNVNLFLYILNPENNNYILLDGGLARTSIAIFLNNTRKSIELCWNSSSYQFPSDKYLTVGNKFATPTTLVDFYGTPGEPTANCPKYPVQNQNQNSGLNQTTPVTDPVVDTSGVNNSVMTTPVSNQEQITPKAEVVEAPKLATNQTISATQPNRNIQAQTAPNNLQPTNSVTTNLNAQTTLFEATPVIKVETNLETQKSNKQISTISSQDLANNSKQIATKNLLYESLMNQNPQEIANSLKMQHFLNTAYILDNLQYLGIDLSAFGYSKNDSSSIGFLILGLTITRFSFDIKGFSFKLLQLKY